jgi:UDP-galactopyranose mutase
VYEYPCAEGDPYYPVPQPKNAELYQQYKALAETVPDVHFVGRLGTYKYYNMDQVVAQALTLFQKLKEIQPQVTRAQQEQRLVTLYDHDGTDTPGRNEDKAA